MLSILNYITWDVSPFIYEGEHFAIGWYGTLWPLGLILWIIAESVIYHKEGIDNIYVWYKFIFLGIGLFVGARIGHCWWYEWYLTGKPISFLGMTFNYRNVFIEKPWLMFDFSHGVHGLSSHGGGVGVLFAVWLLNKKIFHTGTLWIFDRTTIGACLIGFCIRLGNLFNSEIYGKPTEMPWGFLFVNNGDILPCHPTQIYEMLYLLVTFLILIALYRWKNAGQYRGLLFGVFLTVVFTTRILLEFIKQNQAEFESHLGLNMGQWLSIPFLIAGIWLIIYALKTGMLPPIKPQIEQTNNTSPKREKRKKLRASILLFAMMSSLIFVSCNNESSLENNYQGQYFIQKVIDDDFILDERTNHVTHSKCIIFNYTSVDSEGITDTLSAVVTIGRNCWKRKSVKGITLWNRPTITANCDCPSSMNLIAEPIIAKYTHTAVVSPDLQGFGCNKKPQAYCYAERNGKAAADAMFAAMQILDSMGVIYGAGINNIGYSQGAQTAFAALPHFKGARVKTFLGEGIYDLVGYYNQAIERDSIAIPADIPLILITATECVGVKLEYAQCFANATLLKSIEDVSAKQYSFPELNRRIRTRQLSRILSPQLYDSTTEAYNEIVMALKKMSHIPVNDIQGQNIVYVFHSQTDTIMPITQSLLAESRLKGLRSVKVHHKYGEYGSHDDAILPFVKYVLLRIIL